MQIFFCVRDFSCLVLGFWDENLRVQNVNSPLIVAISHSRQIVGRILLLIVVDEERLAFSSLNVVLISEIADVVVEFLFSLMCLADGIGG